jgi:hypothetical protein
VREVAGGTQTERGFSTWPLSKLRELLLDKGIVAELSRETLRRILRDGGVTDAPARGRIPCTVCGNDEFGRRTGSTRP